MRNNVKRRIFGPAIERFDPYADVLGRSFCVLDENVKVPIAVKHSGVQQLVFKPAPSPPLVLLDEVKIREFRLWVLVQILHVGMRRRVIEIEVVLLDVFTVIAFRRHKPEGTLLQDWIPSVPKRHSK